MKKAKVICSLVIVLAMMATLLCSCSPEMPTSFNGTYRVVGVKYGTATGEVMVNVSDTKTIVKVTQELRFKAENDNSGDTHTVSVDEEEHLGGISYSSARGFDEWSDEGYFGTWHVEYYFYENTNDEKVLEMHFTKGGKTNTLTFMK